MAPAPGRQLWPPAAAQLKYSGSRSQSRGCGRQGRKVALPPSAWSPSAHHGGEGNGRCGERARPLRTHTLPCRASGTRHRSRRRRRPLSHPPSRAVAEFSLQTPPSRWRLPLPATPSTVPCSRRRGAAILSPVPPPPPVDIYIAKIGPAGLRPSPHACSLRLLARPHPRKMPQAGRDTDPGPLGRLQGHRATLPQRPPVRGARLRRRSRQPGSSPGLTAASLGPARRRAPHRPA